MNEYEPYMQDTGHRPFERFRPETQDYPRIPAWLLIDEEGRKQYAIGQPLYNQRDVSLDWSADNLREAKNDILKTAHSVSELASGMKADEDRLIATLDTWNGFCANELDDDHRRPPISMMPIATPPFYYSEIWPIVSNTQGGPVHDARQRIIDVYGKAIPRLYAAGELGSVFGHLYIRREQSRGVLHWRPKRGDGSGETNATVDHSAACVPTPAVTRISSRMSARSSKSISSSITTEWDRTR